MTREEQRRLFLARTDTRSYQKKEVAKKVAALLAESAATVPEVEEIMEQAKRYLVVSVNHTNTAPFKATDFIEELRRRHPQGV